MGRGEKQNGLGMRASWKVYRMKLPLLALFAFAAPAATITSTAASGITWRACWDAVGCPNQTDSQSQTGTDSAGAGSSHGNLGYGSASASASATTLGAHGSGSGGNNNWGVGERFISAGGVGTASLADTIFATDPDAAFLQVLVFVTGTVYTNGTSWAQWSVGTVVGGSGSGPSWQKYTFTTVPISMAVGVAITGQVYAASGVSDLGGSHQASAFLQFQQFTFLNANMQPIVQADVVHNPEPASTWLVALGFGALGCAVVYRRRRTL